MRPLKLIATRVLLLGLLVVPILVPAVSRIGGGTIGSFRTGFVAQLPDLFSVSRVDAEQLLILQGPPAPSKFGFEQQWVVLKDFDLQYPPLAELSKDDLAIELERQGYESLQSEASCVHIWKKDIERVRQFVVVWGAHRGVVITATQTPLSQQGAVAILKTIRLNEGACGWN